MKKFFVLFFLLISSLISGNDCSRLSKEKLIRYSPDGKYYLEIYPDKKAILYRKKSARYFAIFRGNFICQTVVFSPNGRFVACGSWENFARLYDLQYRKYTQTFIGHKDWISCLDFSPNSELLATGSLDMTAKLWNIRTGKELQTFVGHSSYITSVSFSPTGKYLITYAWDGSAKLWNVNDAKEIASFTENDSLFFGINDRYKIIGKTNK